MAGINEGVLWMSGTLALVILFVFMPPFCKLSYSYGPILVSVPQLAIKLIFNPPKRTSEQANGCVCVRLFVCLSVSVFLFVWLFVCLFVCLSVCLSVCLLVCLCVCACLLVCVCVWVFELVPFFQLGLKGNQKATSTFEVPQV